ncbi:hypothetical protein PUMCH_002012 [Australozyma saopauloensis]|uniref:Vacuolar membrane protein n=1 Tax=Australozyma saopauloensis TaxID=291208 RepID=A0AAX4H836_9ASCO|nr:hypothetical protein PUMCH_002012 [[Candida] saopauloensis]
MDAYNALSQLFIMLFAFALPSITTLSSKPSDDHKCELVGTFSLFTQAFLGLLCILSLIIKRFYEYPERRTWQVWFFDVSKQIIGAMGVHVFNLLLSILKAQPDINVAKKKSDDCYENDDCTGSPCDWYFLNIVLDCTIGVYVLYLVLRFVSFVCKKYLHVTQIESGEYGPNPHRPSVRAYLKQLSLYFGSLMVTKFVLYGLVECFESELLWFTSNILLSWLNEYPNELEIFIVMFVVPVVMNCIQLVLVDNFIQNQEMHQKNLQYSHSRGHKMHMKSRQDEENLGYGSTT